MECRGKNHTNRSAARNSVSWRNIYQASYRERFCRTELYFNSHRIEYRRRTLNICNMRASSLLKSETKLQHIYINNVI